MYCHAQLFDFHFYLVDALYKTLLYPALLFIILNIMPSSFLNDAVLENCIAHHLRLGFMEHFTSQISSFFGLWHRLLVLLFQLLN